MVLLALAIAAVPAFATQPPAPNCLQDEYSQTAKQTLGCTANDVSVAKVINVRSPVTGLPIKTCTPGNFNFLADFLVETTSTSSRSNIGLYFQTNPQATDALSGTCSDNILTPANDPKYEELDPQSTKISGKTVQTPDNCGDTSSTDTAVCLDANNLVVSCSSPHTQTFPSTQVVTVEIDNFVCPSNVPNGTQLNLPNCTSWQIPGGTIQCDSNDGTYFGAFLNGKPTAIPGTPSKCNCGSIPLGITVQTPGVTVVKDCTIPGNDPAQDHLSKCTFGSTSTNTEGGDVVYTATITNQSNFGNSIVDQICDSQYGTISDDGVVTTKCAAGAFCKAKCTGTDTPFPGCTGTGTANPGTSCISSTTCTTPLPVGTDNGAVNPASCTFTVSQPESKDITNIVNVSGTGASSGTFGPTPSGSVEVVSGENPSTATITKGFLATTQACATVRYSVDVKDTSSIDESVTLTALNDNVFGDLTKCTNTGCTNTGGTLILGTNCGVATAVGTLLNATGLNGFTGGAFASIAASSDYKCAFDAQFCGTLDANSCIQNTDRVSGSFTGDESETGTSFITVTNNALTVKECFQAPSVTSAP
jgi:hypothetical protein